MDTLVSLVIPGKVESNGSCAYLLFVFAVAEQGEEPVQLKLHKSLKLWSFYVDLEESLGTLDSTRKIYERMFDLKIMTPQIVLNYAALLEVIISFFSEQ